MLSLYQAEWCPYSSAVRELLTELQLPFLALPVAAWPEQRRELKERTGGDEIPVLVDEQDDVHQGQEAIFSYLFSRFEVGPEALEHRRRYFAHHEARVDDKPGELLERALATEALMAAHAGLRLSTLAEDG